MRTPLESFMEVLQKRRKCEALLKRNFFPHTSDTIPALDAGMNCELTLPESQEAPPVSSLHAHTHTLRGVRQSRRGDEV